MILVCGATGMFGGKVLEHLLKKGAPVTGLTSNPGKVEMLEAKGAKAAVANLDDPATLPVVLDDIERVFLVTSMDDRIEARELAMIEAAEAAGVKQVVKLFGAVRHRGDPLVTMHENAIERLKATSMSWTLVSPNTVMESNLMPHASTVKQTGMLFGCAGVGQIGMVALDDCAEAAATVLTEDIAKHHGQNHEITGPEALTFAQIAQRISQAIGREIEYIDMPVEEFGQMLVKEAGYDPERVEIEVLCHMRAFRRGDADLVTDTFTKLTGQPSTPVDAVIEAHKAAFGG